MQRLTAKQKELITQWVEETKPIRKQKVVGVKNATTPVDGLDDGQWEQLIKINESEMLYESTNRFILSLRFKWIFYKNLG